MRPKIFDANPFERLAADMTALIEYLGRMTRECLTPAG